jgi:hypothetical protein
MDEKLKYSDLLLYNSTKANVYLASDSAVYAGWEHYFIFHRSFVFGHTTIRCVWDINTLSHKVNIYECARISRLLNVWISVLKHLVINFRIKTFIILEGDHSQNISITCSFQSELLPVPTKPPRPERFWSPPSVLYSG